MNGLVDTSLSGHSPGDWLVNGIVVLVTLGLMVAFAAPRVRRSSSWRATVTPLASIIGSGFLVVAPLLGFTVGVWAVVAMAGIVGLAYLVGGAVRYNIAHVEEVSEGVEDHSGLSRRLHWLGRVAKAVLAVAYVIAVTFYLELLGAFVLRLFGVESTGLQKAVATVLVVFIGAFGFWRGLRMLEFLERYAVEVKLSIIGGLLVALAFHNGQLLAAGEWRLPRLEVTWDLETIRKLLGAFLIVQGFETSRYLRGVYPPEQRIRTMRHAQLASGAIYLVFVGLATVLLDLFSTMSETGIISLSERVAFTLPLLLVVGGAMSQFSAAVADTIGSGGLMEEATRGRVPPHVTYAGVAGLALVLLWSADIFAIIAYASRAFALYYALQCVMAALHAFDGRHGVRQGPRAALFSLLAVLMILTALFGLPAETGGGQ